ncbi:MAG: hypothetical protein R3F11_26880 [Verrucomicrobiales bacterium]
MNRILDPGNSYRQLHGLPALAGIASIPDAISRNALSVEAVVSRLKRFHYALKRLHRIFNDPITSEPIYELKMAFSLHAHLCAEHVAALGGRVAEMREPPLGLDKVPHPALEIAFDEIQAAPRAERLAAAYGIAIPMLIEAMERHRAETNPLADHPTCRAPLRPARTRRPARLRSRRTPLPHRRRKACGDGGLARPRPRLGRGGRRAGWLRRGNADARRAAALFRQALCL